MRVFLLVTHWLCASTSTLYISRDKRTSLTPSRKSTALFFLHDFGGFVAIPLVVKHGTEVPPSLWSCFAFDKIGRQLLRGILVVLWVALGKGGGGLYDVRGFVAIPSLREGVTPVTHAAAARACAPCIFLSVITSL